ncbi:MAG: NDP-sugar synthase [Oscillospiraceae bacterium]
MNAALVIMAAGIGSRYGGDKQVDGVGPHSEMLMEYSIFDAVRAGFDKVVLIIKPEIESLVRGMVGTLLSRLRTAEGKAVEVRYVYQTYDSIPGFYRIPPERTKPFGTCHALLSAREAVREPFIVINADDYYGRSAFAAAYGALQRMPAEGHAAMVGYLLQNTVSENGTVTRGVCQTEGDRLRAVVETYKLKLCADGAIRDTSKGEDGPAVPGESVVSMNFWCFTPWIFEKIEAFFHEFLRALPPEDVKSECLLPVMVDRLLQAGELSVEVLHSADRWFGVTYREDKPLVQAALKALHESGAYPPALA